jgi:hypothetical protein
MSIAVANLVVKPNVRLRPRAPGQEIGDTQERTAGRTFPIAVANRVMNSTIQLRPRAPGQGRGELQPTAAGRTHSHAARRETPAAPGPFHRGCKAHGFTAGRTFPAMEEI